MDLPKWFVWIAGTGREPVPQIWYVDMIGNDGKPIYGDVNPVSGPLYARYAIDPELGAKIAARLLGIKDLFTVFPKPNSPRD